MRRKAFLAFALGFALIAPIFSQGTNETANLAQKEEPMRITLWYDPAQTEVGPLPSDWVGYGIIKDKFNVEMEISSLPSALTDQAMKIQSAAAADMLPDFMCIFDREVWYKLAKKGLFADVSTVLDRMPNRSRLMFDEASLKYCTVDGRLYGFPVPAKIERNEGLVIRKDWLDNLGLKEPKTTGELFEAMKAFTYEDPDQNGKDDTYGFGAFPEIYTYEAYPGHRFQSLLGAFGVEGTWDMHADSFGLMIHKPEFYDFMQYVIMMQQEGVIDPNWQAYKKDDFRAAWKQGKFGVMREQNSALHSKSNYAPFDQNFPSGEWMVLEAPIGPKGHSSTGPIVSAPRIYAVSSSVLDEPGKLEKIADVFEWMSYGEGYYLCGFGREGIEYDLIDGIPVSREGDEGFNGPIGLTYIQLRRLAFNYRSEVELLSRYPSWTSINGRTISPLQTLYEMQDKKWTKTPGQDQMPIPSADLKTFYEQGIAEFFAGKRKLTPESWQKFIAEFDAMGGKKWEEAGRAYATENGYLL